MQVTKQGQLRMFEQSKQAGYICECCGQFVKIYSRKINSSMVLVLLLLYKNKIRDYIHIENYLKQIGRLELRADFAKLRFWGFLDKLEEKRADNSNRNGYYKISGRGIMFCEGKIKAKERAVIFNNRLQSLEGKEISIIDALGIKFNYNELMNK